MEGTASVRHTGLASELHKSRDKSVHKTRNRKMLIVVDVLGDDSRRSKEKLKSSVHDSVAEDHLHTPQCYHHHAVTSLVRRGRRC